MAPVYIKTDHNPNFVNVHSIANLFLAGDLYTESDTSSENPDEIPQDAVSHQDLHYLYTNYLKKDEICTIFVWYFKAFDSSL